MKQLITNIVLPALLLMAACKKEFTDRPSLDQPTSDNYYTTAEQVKAATGTLYGYPWFDFNDKALHCIGEVRGGNMWTGDPAYASFLNFTTTATDPRLQEAWNAFYKVAGWSTILLNTFEDKKANGGNAAILNPGIAEARFIRGVAYFYIGRVWGDAPIVTDPAKVASTGDFRIPRYFQKDLLRFALEDFKYAENALPETDVPGRVTKYSAKGMMAKLYLYRGHYDSAKTKAAEVMASGKYNLFSDYAGMFNSSKHNNNIESLFGLQWVISADWGTQNSLQAYLAPNNLLNTGDGWSAVVPSLDLINNYEPNDNRRRWSVMEHGYRNAEWKPTRENNAAFNAFMANGYVYDTAVASPIGIRNATRSNAAKYVVGPGSGSEPVATQKTTINTYLLRYADILLIYAESVLGANASTTDAAALAAFNKVRMRAGLSPLTAITRDIILRERRSEFAFEGDYWFDIQRQGFAKAKQMIEAQERGTIGDNGSINSLRVTFNQSQMFLPIPLSESVQNPKLNEPPISFY